MPVIYKNHYKNLAISHHISEVVFNPQFSNLFEELHYIYKTYALEEAEKEAFQDAFYSFIAQEEHHQVLLNSALFF
jgi:hypothetical protein